MQTAVDRPAATSVWCGFASLKVPTRVTAASGRQHRGDGWETLGDVGWMAGNDGYIYFADRDAT
jgi:hypothetical protein